MVLRRGLLTTIGVLLLVGCPAEKPSTATTASEPSPAVATTASTAAEPATTSSSAEEETGTWAGQLKIDPPAAVLNYVGAESGDFVPMRFDTNSEVARKIFAVCGDEDLCEFTGAIEMLDEPPPPDASAVARIIRVDSARRLPDPKP